MSEELALLLAASVAAAVGVALIAAPEPAPRRTRPSPESDRRSSVAVIAGLVVGAVVLATSGWVVPAGVTGVASALAIRSRRSDRRQERAARTDALASWIENLRDVLLAGDQPIGAIASTVDTCPAAIRPEVRRLALGLGHLDPDAAFRRFADDLDDPLGDLVASGLLIAVRRGARTVEVLTALASQARSQADRRRIVDAERAPLQREVALLTVVMAGLVGALLVFGRSDYLRAYDSIQGQSVLGAALVLYAALLLRVQRLGARPTPRRFLSAGSAGPHGSAGRPAIPTAERPRVGGRA